MDTLVAVLAGFIIVPGVFATLGEEEIGKGGGFAFVSLAKMFESLTIVKKSKTIFNPVPHQSRLVLNLKNSENK